MNRHEIQKTGDFPITIEPGMRLVLGELGSVVTVVAIENNLVRTIGSGRLEASVFNIAVDGSMTVEQALLCELACDWDPCWHRADFYGCDDLDELEHTSPEAAIAGHFNRASDVVQGCALEVTAYARFVVEGKGDPICICLAVATRQYSADDVLNVLRVAASEPKKPRCVQDTTFNNLSF